MLSGMNKAARLVRQGRLSEATTLIQDALAGRTYQAAGPRDAETPVGRPREVVPGGRFERHTYKGPAGGRDYKLYIPSGAQGQPLPLIVMLHGCTQNADDFAAGTHMNALAEAQGFLVAYPIQTARANGRACWNWFNPADQQRGRGEPAIIAGLTQEIIKTHGVAPGRVYVAGLSAGGAMAAIMGQAYPDLFAAVGVHSGLAPGAAHDVPSAFAAMGSGRQGSGTLPGRSLPTIVFHGTRDTTVHPRNADALLTHLSATLRTRPTATEHPGQVPDGHAYTRALYTDATTGKVLMERWTVEGLGHAWSGGRKPGSYTDPQGPDASAEMVRFFLGQGS